MSFPGRNYEFQREGENRQTDRDEIERQRLYLPS